LVSVIPKVRRFAADLGPSTEPDGWPFASFASTSVCTAAAAGFRRMNQEEGLLEYRWIDGSELRGVRLLLKQQ
jgi:hypothetical protein